MKTKFLAIAFASLLPFAASADISYNYIDFNYQFSGEADFGFGTADTDGFGFGGSYAINDNWFVQFDYSSLSTDPDIDNADEYTFVAGWHGEMFFVKLGYGAADYFTVDDSGYTFSGGIRTMVGDNIELSAYVGMGDYGDVGSSTDYGIGAVWMFNDNFGATFNYDLRSLSDFAATPGFDVDLDTMGLGIRYNF